MLQAVLQILKIVQSIVDMKLSHFHGYNVWGSLLPFMVTSSPCLLLFEDRFLKFEEPPVTLNTDE